MGAVLAFAVLGVGAWMLLQRGGSSSGGYSSLSPLSTLLTPSSTPATRSAQPVSRQPASVPRPMSSGGTGGAVTKSLIGTGVGVGSEIGASALGLTGLAASALAAGFTAGAGVLIWGIADKGWFRGGEEGVKVNPARDGFIAQFGPAGTGDGSGFARLAAVLTIITGEGNGSHYFNPALLQAHTMDEFSKAVQDIANVLLTAGISDGPSFDAFRMAHGVA